MTNSSPVTRIAGRTIGMDAPSLIIAEAGVNHNGDAEMAHRLVDAAAAAGADAIKFQTFRTEALVSAAAEKADYQLAATGSKDTDQASMLKALEMSADLHESLRQHCIARHLLFLSTPYDAESARFLVDLGVPAIKVASTDTTNTQFLRQLDGLELPLLVSTGMTDMAEVRAAVGALPCTVEANRLVLLHCVSEYPAPEDQINLRAMRTLGAVFDCPAGYSDHTAGLDVPVWAVAAGAAVIEKHFTLSRSLPGPDHQASLEPGDLAEMVARIRRLETTLGDGVKRVAPVERRNKTKMQKSVVLTRSYAAGEVIEAVDLACKRPATGLAPAMMDTIVGRRARRRIPADQPLTEDDLMPPSTPEP